MWTSIWGWTCRGIGWGMNTSIKDKRKLVYEDNYLDI